MFNNEPVISTYILNLFFITFLSLLIILYYCKNYINFLHGKLNRFLWRYKFKKKWVKDEKIWIKQFNRSYSFNEIILPDEYSLDTKIFTASPCWMKINPLIPLCMHLLHRYTPSEINVIRRQAYIMSHGVKNFLKFSVAWRNCINSRRIQPFLFLLYVPTTSRLQEDKIYPAIFYQLRGKLFVSF